MEEKEVVLAPEEAYDDEKFASAVRSQLGLSNEKQQIVPLRRSIDARKSPVKIRMRVGLLEEDEQYAPISYVPDFPSVANAKPVIIVGAGPAGLFAALKLIELGVKPIILERGKDVRARRRDLAAINKEQIVNPDSNYCFGEGGAGTYSDGKLYTRSKKRGDIRRILEILVAHGATEEILVDAHPHIGTNKLPKLIAAIRETILSHGGEVHFNTRVTEFIKSGDALKGVKTADGTSFLGESVILATGHSARDIFELLQKQDITIKAKPFALGVRIEHPQQIIDQAQYHTRDRGPYLPAASYSLVHQTFYQKVQRGVFSFCMCPGGFIVPAATAPGEIVVNGMSPSRRDSFFANSGIVVAVEDEDVAKYAANGELRALAFQKEVEQRACQLTGGGQIAPAQRLVDFVEGKVSPQLNDTSYQPGLQSLDMREVLPPMIHERLKEAFKAFGKKMKGYYTNEAQIVGVESRTSSPVSIPRDRQTLEHIQTARLFPCGEGAGYAGGIVSAAMDGERVAQQVVNLYVKS